MNSIDFITNFDNNTVAHALYLHKCRQKLIEWKILKKI
jgi:hypothetical protein